MQQMDPRMINALLGAQAPQQPGQPLTAGEAVDQSAMQMPALMGGQETPMGAAPDAGGRATATGAAPEILPGPSQSVSPTGFGMVDSQTSQNTALAMAELMRRNQQKGPAAPTPVADLSMAGG